jgi:hypothetical protein
VSAHGEAPPSTLRSGGAPYVLSALIAVFATIAAAGGLSIHGLYRDNIWIVSAWRGNDLVTLLVAVPLLVGALLSSRRGSVRAQLVWLGMLAYMLYGYAFYLFGAAFNRFFLVYVALFALSVWGLIVTVPRVDVVRIGGSFSRRTPARLIAAYMLLTGLGLGTAWIAMSLGFVVTGKVPAPVVASDHPTGIVFALDLSLLVPGFILGGVWLWRRRPWGYVLAAIMNIKGATYTLALALGASVAARAGVPGAAAEVPLWAAFTAAGVLASVILLASCAPLRSKPALDADVSARFLKGIV